MGIGILFFDISPAFRTVVAFSRFLINVSGEGTNEY